MSEWTLRIGLCLLDVVVPETCEGICNRGTIALVVESRRHRNEEMQLDIAIVGL